MSPRRTTRKPPLPQLQVQIKKVWGCLERSINEWRTTPDHASAQRWRQFSQPGAEPVNMVTT